MGNGQHEQKVDKLQMLNPNCMCMIIEFFFRKFVSEIQYVYHNRTKNNIRHYGKSMFLNIFILNT
jgi:hypothetical protein